MKKERPLCDMNALIGFLVCFFGGGLTDKISCEKNERKREWDSRKKVWFVGVKYRFLLNRKHLAAKQVFFHIGESVYKSKISLHFDSRKFGPSLLKGTNGFTVSFIPCPHRHLVVRSVAQPAARHCVERPLVKLLAPLHAAAAGPGCSGGRYCPTWASFGPFDASFGG